MSGEIKFRGVNAVTGDMIFGQLVKTSEQYRTADHGFTDCHIIDGHVDTRFFMNDSVRAIDARATVVKPETVCQYIELKDIDGNEIFQDDICEVMYYTPFGDKTNDFYGKWVVTKWMGQFVLVSGKERIGFTDFADVVSSEYVSNLGTVCELSETVNVRVIGNVHQNSGLLK